MSMFASSVFDLEKTSSVKEIHRPFLHGDGYGVDPYWTGSVTYLPAGENIRFPGPLMSGQMRLDNLIQFIHWKSQECLSHVDEPGQKEAYYFWRIMGLLCSSNREVLLVEIAALLCEAYGLLRNRLRARKKQDEWSLPLVELLCSAEPEDKVLDVLVKMGEKLDAEGLTYASHLYYVVARKDIEMCVGSGFKLIGCNSLPVSQSALREAIERTEVYEYVCSLTSGFAQPNFQIYKYYHATKLAEMGLFDQALEYCKTIAAAIVTFPEDTTKNTLELTIALAERLHQGKGEEPEWLMNLRQLQGLNLRDKGCGLLTHEMLGLQQPHLEQHITPWEVFESLYTTGELLGEGGFGCVCAGVRNKDAKQVGIKYMGKSEQDRFITIPGETQRLPLEVALMDMVSRTSCCNNVLELIEWFEMSDCYILILEKPSPCMDVSQFLKVHSGGLSEALARNIMCQVVQAARHCCDCGVLHRDIKTENLLINPETLEVKLIDFGCGDLLKNTNYEEYLGTWSFSPPEWVCNGEYLGQPATIWSLGVLLFHLVCGYLPFHTEDDIVYHKMQFPPTVSEDCYNLIQWCLDHDPDWRPTFDEILRHKWFQHVQD